jgi:hypothetical protein
MTEILSCLSENTGRVCRCTYSANRYREEEYADICEDFDVLS